MNKFTRPMKPVPHQQSAVKQAVDLAILTSAPKTQPSIPSNATAPEFCIQKVRARIASYVADGTHSVEVIDAVYNGSTFLPQEGYLFDYKRAWPETRPEIAKYARHVAAFHNVFGGFIFFGVEEVESNKFFEPCVETEPKIDSKQFNDLLREYLTSPVEVTIKSHQITNAKGECRYVTLLHIPKRTTNTEPIAARKDLLNDKGKHLIKSGEIYIRDGDNSIPAQLQQHWKTIYGQRHNPYLDDISPIAPDRILENNLPDRSLIYGQFVGRTHELEQLWGWFSDDFSRVRVLAGEGGLGKTSIAYEFASDFCRTGPAGFDCVIWLTAKKRQFRALANSFEELGLEVFETTGELLRQMGESMGLRLEELADCPDLQLPRLVKQAAANIAALVVIDDLDSLELDEQKRCIEVCQQFSTTKSRFLFTTRKNFTASSASSIEIEGFGATEFKEFIEVWRKRLTLPALSGNEVSSLRAATRGSPLFTESILRLLKLGMPLNDALRLWGDHLGIEVRNAVLQREVMQLGMEARKVLALIATLGSCSFTEGGLKSEVQHPPRKVCTWIRRRSTASFSPRTG